MGRRAVEAGGWDVLASSELRAHGKAPTHTYPRPYPYPGTYPPIHTGHTPGVSIAGGGSRIHARAVDPRRSVAGSQPEPAKSVSRVARGGGQKRRQLQYIYPEFRSNGEKTRILVCGR